MLGLWDIQTRLERSYKDPEKWCDLGSFVDSLVGSGQVFLGPGARAAQGSVPHEGSQRPLSGMC